ncbi:MAG: 1,4-alpha-glucan branching protein GlgB [Pikeienuella sp.]|uniref:1,4-alpha-glucan branching protein GlgB n=1 Tax=Pikeienuella sp. TaxID=2831957 RepID=UPI00391D9806
MEEARLVAEGRHEASYDFLGLHEDGDGWSLRAFAPGANAARLEGGPALRPLGETGVFAARLAAPPEARSIMAEGPGGAWSFPCPYRFGPLLGALDEHLIGEGTHLRLWEALGAHLLIHEGVAGVAFAVWAPRARRVSVVGDFNAWDGRRNVMRRRGAGLWEAFVPGLEAGARYKFELLGPDGALLPPKADPLGRAAELRPGDCSVVARPLPAPDMAPEAPGARARPISIYEVHLASWRRGPGGRPLTWDELAEALPPYAAALGFTHIEALPVMEHPFDGSWGYQPVGLFAPTRRHGPPERFSRFVEACAEAGLGLILDWVPAHFPEDAHGLARFDGEPLYEYADPREGAHPDWGTLVYDFGRAEVRNFLLASALYWVKARGVAGLRVDAVAAMLYRDHSRLPGEWLPNVHGGRENLEAESFIRLLTETLAREAPGALLFAEESSAWPGVTAPAEEGGLGFDFKWNMGWAHDTLRYMSLDPAERPANHRDIAFSFHYAFSEAFVLALSHDEVAVGRGSVLGRMPGDGATRLAQLRTYYAFMWAHPGKKLLFMGQEFAQSSAWDHEAALPWGEADAPGHAGVARLVADLNRLYAEEPALHALDAAPEGFRWIDGGAADTAALAFLRQAPGAAPLMALFNFSAAPLSGWRFGAPAPGRWRRVLDTEKARYGGPGCGPEIAEAEAEPAHGFAHSLALDLPPFSAVWLRHEEDNQ